MCQIKNTSCFKSFVLLTIDLLNNSLLLNNLLNSKLLKLTTKRKFAKSNLSIESIACLLKSKKMKNLIIVLSALFAFGTTAIAQTAIKNEEQKTIYVCPSHPDQTNSSSGKCPKCGMDLIKTTEKIDTHAFKGSQPMTKTVTKYVCPMDGSTSDQPGKCSKCAMAMVKTTEKVDTHAFKGSQPMTKTVTKYVCSMDGTTSDQPGQCSKCGMDMVKVTEKMDTHSFKGSQPASKLVTKYVCPMDGSTSDKPGKCPKCGMDMTQKENPKH